jgi:single-strand DNA-binding protein
MFMNKCIVAGNLCDDIELKTTTSGKTFCDFVIAVNYLRKDEDGNSTNSPTYVPCQAWGRNAEFIARHFTKGQGIGVIGRYHVQRWKDKDGKTKSKTAIQVDETYFNGGSQESPKPTATVTLTECDDIPF